VSAIKEVDSRVPRHFTENDISFLQTYANMVATAVNRLRLMNALRETAKEKGRLLLELQHRIKNNLQVITALISTQSRRSTSPEVKEELKSIEDRIETLRLVHDKLYSAGEVDRVDLASYLAELAGDCSSSTGTLLTTSACALKSPVCTWHLKRRSRSVSSSTNS
jgi:signal transduction protein with GAF and PtsI domain